MRKRHKKKRFKMFCRNLMSKMDIGSSYRSWELVDPIIQYESALRGIHPFHPFCEDIIEKIKNTTYRQ